MAFVFVPPLFARIQMKNSICASYVELILQFGIHPNLNCMLISIIVQVSRQTYAPDYCFLVDIDLSKTIEVIKCK